MFRFEVCWQSGFWGLVEGQVRWVTDHCEHAAARSGFSALLLPTEAEHCVHVPRERARQPPINALKQYFELHFLI